MVGQRVRGRRWSARGAGMMVAAAWLAAPVAAQEACERFPVDEASYECLCAGGSTGGVWGSGPYTGDSDLCAAAQHAGVLGDTGGVIMAIRLPGQAGYTGGTANGVTTWDWGSYPVSVDFDRSGGMGPDGSVCGTFPPGAVRHDCTCPAAMPAGAVWGSGPYSADSDICTAARHAGVIGAAGGAVVLMTLPGLDLYRGSSANGVTTWDWGPYGESITFDANAR